MSDLFIDWASFWEQERHEVEWLIEPILARGRGHAFFAWQKTGKSLLLLALLADLVLRDPEVVVIYFDYEMTEADVWERLCDMGYGPHSDFSRLRYALLPQLDPLDTAIGGKSLLHIVDTVHSEFPGKHLVIILDTMGRAVQGDEDKADTIRAFYRYTGIALKQRGWTWGRLDHAGKDREKGQRGTSAKGDDVDIVWRIEKMEGGLRLKREAARMGWVPEKVGYMELADPLRFQASKSGWPIGTEQMAEMLNTLLVPVDTTVRAARKALTEVGQGCSQAVLSAAVKYRKEAVVESVTRSVTDSEPNVTRLRIAGTGLTE